MLKSLKETEKKNMENHITWNDSRHDKWEESPFEFQTT